MAARLPILSYPAQSNRRNTPEAILQPFDTEIIPIDDLSQVADLLAQRACGIVLLDARSSDMDGLHITGKLSEIIALHSPIPLLCLLPEMDQPSEVARYYQRGATVCVVEPITPELLWAQISGLLVLKMAEQQRLESALSDAKAVAEAADRAKSEFLATISHDIRTPMNTIFGMNDLLERTKLSAKQAKYLRVSQQAGSALLALINNVLDLSRIEAGKLDLVQSPFAWQELVRGACNIMRVQARKKGLRFQCRTKSDLSVSLVKGDAQRVQQVLINLLGNAIKFTQKGHVTLSVDAPKRDFLRFTINDSGCGIEPERLKAIFLPFTQESRSISERYGGSGLGLTICKRLVRAMGGEIHASSTLGKGSRFQFSVPLPEAVGSSLSVNKKPDASKTTISQAPLEILVADDTPDNRFYIQSLLEETPHTLHLAEDGQE
ncbi:MAG: hypothetical protein HQL53_05170, partial [Magnetococcales bacterium]|nr:hypothetical protein [Magnetococcales bacterium]